MAMAASSSTSASASTSANPNSNSDSSYDIFISHRGPDVKNTFASYLYRRLFSHRLKVFLDREELQQGDYINPQIEGAIQTASVHVAIFSPRYAESTWCLNELLSMLKSGAPIIPVFYNVKPAELRWTQGNYAQALQQKRQKRHDSATVEQWKKALSSVAEISGFELEACNGDEGEFLEKVVESVLRKIKKPLLHVANYPTGLDEKARDFGNQVLSRHQQSGSRVLGIVGLGGAGKTTLAKQLFNQKLSHYKISCFLSDVRETVDKGSVTSLQSKLLTALTRSTVQIDHKDEGMEKLKMHLSLSEILLILDDVDKVDQVDALLPRETSVHLNSFILITSRNKDVLRMSGVGESSIYKLDGLSEQHSLELFCCYAFSRRDPLPGFEVLTQKFLKACQGLPLSLKVLGALLFGKNDMSYWHDQLAKLENILPDEIQERLKISYDTLDREEKQMFLDIACSLKGHDMNKAIRIWDASRWKGRLGFQNLQNKCLVEVEVFWYNRVKKTKNINMHDHIRDLGRHIAGSLLPCRLWRCGENVIDDLLQQSHGNVINVRAIRMVLSEYHGDEEFNGIQMRKLQLVDTEGSLLERIWNRVKSPDLIWLCWKDYPYSSLPSWIPMKNLRVLEVSEGKLETLCQQESQLPVCLEDLRVRGCHQLKSMRGMEQATKLQRLEVLQCSELEALPSMETLQSLEELWVMRCVKLKSIRGLEQATKLRQLVVSGCSQLEALPSMETLQSLEELNTDGCVKLKSIRGLEQATKLRHLHVSGCYELEALPSMETLQSLEELWVMFCVKLKSIRGLEQATKLRRLYVGGCSEMEALSSMETLQSLEELSADGCVKLKSIRGLEQATKLRQLVVSRCAELEALPSMETLQSLEWLFADECVKLKSIRGLEQATKLRLLSVSGCSELEALPSMETLQSLEKLFADGCVKLKSIRGLEQATKLQGLDVSGCSELEALPSMETLQSLETLWAEGCVKLKSIRGLEQATKLQYLNVSGWSELEALPSMETLQSLEWLRAEGCVKLKSIRGLEQATKLERLDIGGCCELEEVEGVEYCTWLKKFDIYGCFRLHCPVWE